MVGLLYGLFVSCGFGTRQSQQKISLFMPVAVPVVTEGFFLFTGCLSMFACMMLEYAPGFDLHEFPILMSMRVKFSPQPRKGVAQTANH